MHPGIKTSAKRAHMSPYTKIALCHPALPHIYHTYLCIEAAAKQYSTNADMSRMQVSLAGTKLHCSVCWQHFLNVTTLLPVPADCHNLGVEVLPNVFWQNKYRSEPYTRNLCLNGSNGPCQAEQQVPRGHAYTVAALQNIQPGVHHGRQPSLQGRGLQHPLPHALLCERRLHDKAGHEKMQRSTCASVARCSGHRHIQVTSHRSLSQQQTQQRQQQQYASSRVVWKQEEQHAHAMQVLTKSPSRVNSHSLPTNEDNHTNALCIS
jgi:hypothetical protein